jgi:hypothetical protein
MVQRTWLTLAVLGIVVSAPALGQETWLPAEPPAGLALRTWLTGPEAATVEIAIRFGHEPWCTISGRFSPERHVSSTGYVAAGTDCGLDRQALDRVLGPGGVVPVQLKGTVQLESGAALTVSQTIDADLADVWDATIDLSGGRVTFNAVKG